MKRSPSPAKAMVLIAWLLALTVGASSAHALLNCDTTVKKIMHYPHGPIIAQVRLEGSGIEVSWNICSTSVDQGNMTVDQCYRFLNTLNISIALTSKLRFIFFDSVPDANGLQAGSCEQVRQWGSSSLATSLHAYLQFAP